MYYPVTGFDDDRGDGRVLAIEGNDVYVSDDNSLTWVAGVGSEPTISWQDAVANSRVFCAVGSPTKCMTSDDGSTGTWTTRTMPAPYTASANYQGVRVITPAGRFGACASSSGLGQATVAISDDDGVNWTRLGPVGQFTICRQVSYSPELDIYVVVLGTAPGLRYSEDGGSTWVDCTVTDINGGGTITNAAYFDILWSPRLELFVGGGSQLGGAATFWSSDGKNFSYNNSIGSGRVFEVCQSDDVIMSTVAGSNSIYYTTDGQTWSIQAVGGVQAYPRCAFNGEVFVVGSFDGNRDNASSTNVTSWSIHSNNGFPLVLNALTARFV